MARVFLNFFILSNFYLLLCVVINTIPIFTNLDSLVTNVVLQ